MYLRINENVEIVKNYSGGLIIDKSERITNNINHSGVEIFSMCNGNSTIEDVVHIIKSTYNINDEIILGSIRDFIDEYLNKNILILEKEKNDFKVNIKGDVNSIIPIHLSMEVTSNCQLKCIHCFNSSGTPKEDELTSHQIAKIAKEFSELGTQSAFVTGGEPFLKKDICFLIEALAENFISVTIASNGFSLTDEIVSTLSKYNNITVQISVDGNEKTHDEIRGVVNAYIRTMSNIATLCNNNIPVVIAFTLNDNNRYELDDVILHTKKLGCKGVNIGLTADAGRAKDNKLKCNFSKDFIEILSAYNKKYTTDDFYVGLDIDENKIRNITDSIEHKNKCGAGYGIMHIFPNGNVSMCPSITKIHLGSLKKQGIGEILNFKNVERTMNIPSPTREICGDCENFNSCGHCIGNMLAKSSEECVVINGMQL